MRAGAYIDDDSPRREAFNIVFSMPVGTPPEAVLAATAEAARGRPARNEIRGRPFNGHANRACSNARSNS